MCTETEVRARLIAAVALLAFTIVILVHLTALLAGWSGTSDRTMGLLIPPLAVYLGTVLGLPHRRAETPIAVMLLVALFFGWLGDLADPVLLKLVLFGIGHVAYGVAWWPWRRSGLLGRPRARIVAVAAYAGFAVLMVGLLAGPAGWMTGPIVAYAVALSTMAVLASGAGIRAALGGALFVMSDSLLAWKTFVGTLPVADLPANDLLVMTSYLAAQWLVISGSRRRLLGVSRRA